MTSGPDLDDPRTQRALALRRLATARYELECSIGYLRNSDRGSTVIVEATELRDQVDELVRTLEWRQQRDQTP